MRKAVFVALSVVLPLAILVGGGVWWVRLLSAAFFMTSLLAIVLIVRRFRRSRPHMPLACHVAAAVALTIGVGFVISGIGHSFAVGSLAWRNSEPYGPLVILRFTTGAMLVYAGAMNIALCRAIGAGRGWAIGVGAASGLLFWMYLAFTLPLPGTGGSVPRALALWTFHLLWLGAAAFASRQRRHEVADAVPA